MPDLTPEQIAEFREQVDRVRSCDPPKLLGSRDAVRMAAVAALLLDALEAFIEERPRLIARGIEERDRAERERDDYAEALRGIAARGPCAPTCLHRACDFSRDARDALARYEDEGA